MKVHPLHHYPHQDLDALLSSLPFYKSVKKEDPWQYDVLISHSRVAEYEPGETLLNQGQSDQWWYFLLKGQLAVLVGETKEPQKLVNHITPGEVFGDLAVLIDHKRTASVIASPECRRALVFGTDFSVFGELIDYSQVSLATKLIYYRNMVHNLRWKLDVYRMSYPDHSYASNHRKIKLFLGAKDTQDELLSLDKQARALARLLVDWNVEFDRLTITPNHTVDYASLTAFG